MLERAVKTAAVEQITVGQLQEKIGHDLLVIEAPSEVKDEAGTGHNNTKKSNQ